MAQFVPQDRKETEQMAEEMKRIFVVDGGLGITSVKIPKSDWGKKAFCAKIGNQPIVVLKQTWGFTTYAGFATFQGAQHFKELVQKVRRRRRACLTYKGKAKGDENDVA